MAINQTTRDEALANANRRRIVDLVRREPGVYYTEISRALALAPSTVDHHVRKLTAWAMIRERRIGGRRHFYPIEATAGGDV